MTAQLPTRSIPLAPGGVPLLGHALRFRTDPLGLFESLRPLGDLVRIRIGWQTAFVVTSTRLTHELFVAGHRHFDKGLLIENFTSVFGNGLLSSVGEIHRVHRLLMQPAFHHDRLAEYVAVMRDQVTDQVSAWHGGAVLDARTALSTITLGVVTKTLTCTDVGDELAAEVQRRLPRLLELTFQRATAPHQMLNRLPLPRNREFESLAAGLQPVVDRIIDDYRRSGTRRPDLVSTMLDARDATSGATLNDVEIHDQIMTILLAGSETTATALSWTLLLLDRHPEVAARARAEIAAVLGDRPIEHSDLPRLAYTAQVINESLRHSPPIWLITRRALEDVELGGYRIPAGCSVLLSPYLTGHDPELITDPEAFDPDRWASGNVTPEMRQAALPFGGGPHQCIGNSFAVVEMTVALATILRRWDVRVAPGTAVTRSVGLTYYPGGLSLLIEPRCVEVRGSRG